MTWMVTPSPRSRIAPGISCTVMPGWRSSGGRPGWTSTVPLVEPEVGDHRGAVVGAGPGSHLEVGGGDLVVGAGHADQVGLLGRGEPAGLGGAADQDHPVDLDALAAGEDQLGHGAGDARRGRLPGDPGLRPLELVGVVAAGAGHAVVVGGRRGGGGRDRRFRRRLAQPEERVRGGLLGSGVRPVLLGPGVFLDARARRRTAGRPRRSPSRRARPAARRGSRGPRAGARSRGRVRTEARRPGPPGPGRCRWGGRRRRCRGRRPRSPSR